MISLYMGLDHLRVPNIQRHNTDYPLQFERLSRPIRQLLLRWGFEIIDRNGVSQVHIPIYTYLSGLKWEQWERSEFGWKKPEEFRPASWENEWLLPHPLYGKGKAMGCDRTPYDLLLIGQKDTGFGYHFETVYPVMRPSLMREDSAERMLRFMHVPPSQGVDSPSIPLDFIDDAERAVLTKWGFRFNSGAVWPPLYPHTGRSEYHWQPDNLSELSFDSYSPIAGLPRPIRWSEFFVNSYAPFIVANVDEKDGRTIRIIPRPSHLVKEDLPGERVTSMAQLHNRLDDILETNEGLYAAWELNHKTTTVEEFLQAFLSSSNLPVMAKYQLKLWLARDGVHPQPIVLKNRWSSGSPELTMEGSLNVRGEFIADGYMAKESNYLISPDSLEGLEKFIAMRPNEVVIVREEVKSNEASMLQYFIVPPHYPNGIAYPFKDNPDGSKANAFNRSFIPHWMFFGINKDPDYNLRKLK